MSEQAPEFKSGNGYFVKALNALGEYAQRHGIDPAGLPGWSQGEFGWTPPYGSSALDGSIKPWDIVAGGTEDGEKVLSSPNVIASLTDITDELTVTNTAFVPAIDTWLVAEIIDLDSPAIEIKLLETWEGFPSAYEFDTTGPSPVFVAARLPLWRFFAPDLENPVDAVTIGPGILGHKHVNGRVLTLGYRLVDVAINEDLFTVTVPFFE